MSVRRERLPAVGLVFVVAGFLFAHSAIAAELPRLSPLFGDHACLQAGKPVPIWGWATPGERVSIQLGKHSVSATTGTDGRWDATLPALEAGESYTLTVKATAGECQSNDILAGEVWLASGQSNMFWPLAKAQTGPQAIAAAGKRPRLRLFRIDLVPSSDPLREPTGKWVVCSPAEAAKFSGVAYFFATELQDQLDRPVGIIMNALGGTPIESWLPPTAWTKNAALTRIQTEQAARAIEHRQKIRARRGKNQEPGNAAAEGDDALPVDKVVDRYTPSGCFNAGIAPIAPYAIRGVIWYQGEWNVPRPDEYRTLFPMMINEWRRQWGRADLPFYFVQLPNYGKISTDPVEAKKGWAEFRWAQTSALTLPHTGMAVTIDVGDAGMLHPPRKQEVGQRLARLALARDYGKKLEADGPALTDVTSSGGSLRLRLAHADGLALRNVGDGRRSGFAIAGDDGKWRHAEARIEKDTVVLSSPDAPAPRDARYLWASSPVATLYNAAGLPAAPFRTDNR